MDLAHFWNTSGAYEIKQSLRFNSADSAYLNRTPASEGNRKTWTWSGWVKRGKLGINAGLLIVSTWPSPATFIELRFTSSDEFDFSIYNSGSYAGRKITSAVYRDPSSWYHIVATFDSTNATASDRMRLYVNGERVTAFGTSTDPALNTESLVNSTVSHTIARFDASSEYMDGYLAEVNFIDGTALTPSSFGETDPITGAWIPKKYSGSYGTNGFYLKFESSGIGTDSSGNSNTWTANNFSTSGTGTDVMSDTPTNNWCTLNPLNTYNNNTSNGNLTYSQTNSNNAVSQGTIGMPSGKWYWEINAANVGNGVYGITRYEYPTQAVFGCSNGYGTGFSPALNEAYINSSTASSSYCSSPSAPASGTYMFAFDADARKFWMGVNGTWYTKTGGSAGDPGAGTNELFGTSDITAGVVYRALIGGSAVTTVSGDINFGQRSFSYTPPSNFKALCTANLPEPTIKKGSKYFDTKLYTGTDASLTVNYDFSPDFVWIKSRSHASDNSLYDIVRGTNLQLRSNSTNAEINDTNGFNSFNSNGFTLGVDTGDNINAASRTYVAWAWDANGAGSSNTAGTITSTVSANATAGFSIVTYTGTGANATVGHGLGVAPSFIIVKNRNTSDQSWYCYHKDLGASYYIYLNLTAAAGTGAAVWNGAPSSSVFTLGTSNAANGSTLTYVAYCFSEVAGYSRISSYVGTGSSDGPFVWCGFRPAFLLRKSAISAADDWVIQDLRRPGYNETKDHLTSNQANAEVTNSTETGVDILSNGFKVRSSNYKTNSSGATYVFIAFAEHPFKYANAR